MKPALDAVFAAPSLAKSANAEIQQRAIEYRKLLSLGKAELVNTVSRAHSSFLSSPLSLLA
jgi:hypothetical protein